MRPWLPLSRYAQALPRQSLSLLYFQSAPQLNVFPSTIGFACRFVSLRLEFALDKLAETVVLLAGWAVAHHAAVT